MLPLKDKTLALLIQLPPSAESKLHEQDCLNELKTYGFVGKETKLLDLINLRK
jgi:hypothetical protein